MYYVYYLNRHRNRKKDNTNIFSSHDGAKMAVIEL